MQDEIDADRQVLIAAEDEERNRGDDRGDHRLGQDGGVRYLIAVDATHDRRQPPVEPADEEQPGKRVVIDGCIEDEERDHDQGHDHRHASAKRGLHRLQDGVSGASALLRNDHHRAEGQDQVGGHDDDRAPDEVAGDRLAISDLDAHVERHFDAEQGKDDQAIEGGVARVQPEGVPREVVGRRVAAQQPGEARESDREDGRAVDHEDAVDHVLGHAESHDRQGGGEPNDRQDDDSLLPESGERILQVERRERQKELEQRHDQVGSRHHNERSGPPGAEAGEEAPEGTQGLVGPDVDRALAGEHQAELAGDDGAGNEKGEKAEDPVDEGGGAGLLDDRALDGEEDDRHEDRDHVESAQHFGQDAGRDPLGEQLSRPGGGADGCGCRCHNPSLRV